MSNSHSTMSSLVIKLIAACGMRLFRQNKNFVLLAVCYVAAQHACKSCRSDATLRKAACTAPHCSLPPYKSTQQGLYAMCKSFHMIAGTRFSGSSTGSALSTTANPTATNTRHTPAPWNSPNSGLAPARPSSYGSSSSAADHDAREA